MLLSQKPFQMQNRYFGTAKGVVVNIDRLMTSGNKMIGIRVMQFCHFLQVQVRIKDIR